MGVPKIQDAKNWAGLDVVDRDGTHVGTCTALYVDEATEQPEWLSVDRTDGPTAFVPVLEATERDGKVHLAFPAQAVADAPTFGSPSELSKDEEATLYRHYGVPFSDSDSDSLLPAEGATGQLPSSADEAPTDRLPSVEAEPVPVVPPVEPAAEPVLPLPPVAASAPIELAVVEEEVDVVEPAPRAVVPPPTLPPPALLPPIGTNRMPALAGGAVALAGILAAAAALRRRQARSRPSAQVGRMVRGGSAAVTARATQAARAAAAATSGAAAGASKSVRSSTTSTVSSAAKKAAKRKARAQTVGRRKARAQKAGAARVASQAAAGGTRAASAVRSVPEAVAQRGHRARRSWHATVTESLAVLSGGAGYLLGARAGHDRYREIERGAARLADSPVLPEPLRRPAAALSGALREGEHGRGA